MGFEIKLADAVSQLELLEILQPSSPRVAEEGLDHLSKISHMVSNVLNANSANMTTGELFFVQNLVKRITETGDRLGRLTPLGIAVEKVKESIGTVV